MQGYQRRPRSNDHITSLSASAAAGVVTPAKRARLTTAQPEQDKFLRDAREQAKKDLSSLKNKDPDLGYMMKSVRGLIDSNGEIWSACKEHLVPRSPGSWVKMKKIFFEKVSVVKCTKLTITAQKTLFVYDFGAAPTIPTCLSSLISLDPPLEGKVFPCYTTYLKKAALLNDGVLVSFLTQLQEHLEGVQVFLGRIESWLSQPAFSTQFLNELFGSGVALIEDVDESMCKAAVPHAGTICIRCYSCQSSHTRKKVRHVGTGTGSRSPSFIRNFYCDGTDKCGLFYDPEPVTLFTSENALKGGEMNMKFNLCTDDGKEKLKTCVTFLRMYE